MGKTEVLYGWHPVVEALKAGRRRIFEIYAAGDRRAARLVTMHACAAERGIPVKTVTREQIEAMAGADGHQGIAARVSVYPVSGTAELIDASLTAAGGFFGLLLDSVVDPRHLGALGHVRLVRVANLVNSIRNLKEKGVWIAGTDRAAAKSIYTCDLTGPLAVVIGGEEKGLRPLVRTHCDFLMTIPQQGPLNSLNAAAAGAVVLYEAFRQRLAAGKTLERKV